MKKLITVILSTVFVLSLFAGCGKKEETGSRPSQGEALQVGLIQLVEHPSLDEIRTAIEKEIQRQASEKGLTVEIDYKNAQNDMSLISSICRNFVEDQVDVIVAIATPATQGAASATTEIPIVFSAVTDPVATGLVTNLDQPEGNITGTSDYIDVEKIFNMAEVLTPGIETYGFIYNKGEVNSSAVVEEAKTLLEGKGFGTVEKAVSNSGEVQQAAKVLMESCDAVFVPIDNTVASAMGVVAQEGIATGTPIYAAADSLVNDGALATIGINYTQLGTQTGEMVMKILEGTAVGDIPVEIMKEGNFVLNEETAEALQIPTAQIEAARETK